MNEIASPADLEPVLTEKPCCDETKYLVEII
jgi:hypothetical protein